MEIPMSGVEQNKSIEDQYSEGPIIQDLNIPQDQAMTVAQAHEFLDSQLPLMRKQGEYDRLVIEQLTNDVLLNRRPSNQVPGLLGLELKVREIKAQDYLTSYTARLSDNIAAQQEKEKEIRSASEKTGVQIFLEYNGENAGEIVAISKGKPVEEATKIVIDKNNIEQRITFSIPDSNYKMGYRELSFIPGDSIVKYNDGSCWSEKK